MNILGISAYYHDAAAALIRDGVIVAAASEERFSRKKNDSAFPRAAILYCLREAGVSGAEIDNVAFYDKPFQKFDRLVETYLQFAPRGFASFRTSMPVWMNEKLFQRRLLLGELAGIHAALGANDKLLFSEHHYSHAASAFFPSPFEEAAVLTLDGVGEWATTTSGVGRGRELEITKEIHFPHSIGLLYSAFTYYTGFKVNSDEYKVMGLAPYGEPKYAQAIFDEILDVKPDGSFRLAMDYFDYCTGLTMTNGKFDALFGGPARRSSERLTQRHMDLAASVQAVTEQVVLRLTRALAKETGLKNLCMAGGVALNCVANGKVLRDGAFDDIWVQPAAGDAGGAIGAALAACHTHKEQPRAPHNGRDGMSGAFLGPAYSDAEICAALDARGAVYETLDDGALLDETVAALEREEVIGWFQGRMEFGPRSLGSRSILGDARSAKLQAQLNLKIKYRESFRPFAPAVAREDVADYFELDGDSPYMLLVAPVKERRRIAMTRAEQALEGVAKLNVPRSDIPAVTHIDYSARIQTVSHETNPRFHALLMAMKRRTGCSVVINTSFNVRDEPIVCSPDDAYRCFMASEMDMLVIGNHVLRKARQAPAVAKTADGAGDGLIPARLLACLKAPGGPQETTLTRGDGAYRCVETGEVYPDVEGAPSLLSGFGGGEAGGVAERVKAFYEEYPLPSYEGLEDFGELVNRGQKNAYAQGLLDAIGYNKLILDCGCGAGQLTHFLSLNNNSVLGVDLSISKLKLALEHKTRNGVPRAGFTQMNIFDLAIKDEAFDVVISAGVLHHTKDARKAFDCIVRKVRPGGVVIVGLSNRYARAPTWVRSKLIGALGMKIDPVCDRKVRDPRKTEIWAKDQSYNPHETGHSVDEVMGWFAANHIAYLNCYPPIIGSKSNGVKALLDPSTPSTRAARVLTQLGWLGATAAEGAPFMMAGRRAT
jgi:carbamoyltransferase